ncbi:helix-turn-helix domain-containing protein [Clostridioides difficile]|nr:helix-turn-helix domain-containing protein [Clostridioides difficile]
MDTMSERIMQIRAEQKLSKKDFGEIIGLSKSIISCYKKGLRKITERSTNIICREFSINKEWILTGKNEMYISREEDTVLINIFDEILNSDNKNIKELIKRISILEDKHINLLNQLVN